MSKLDYHELAGFAFVHGYSLEQATRADWELRFGRHRLRRLHCLYLSVVRAADSRRKAGDGPAETFRALETCNRKHLQQASCGPYSLLAESYRAQSVAVIEEAVRRVYGGTWS